MKKAEKIFVQGACETENFTAGFIKYFWSPEQFSDARIRITGRTFYRVYLNGQFLWYGPARAAHGHSRVDELSIDKSLRVGENVLVVEVVGYHKGNLYVTGETSFLALEIEIDGEIVVASDTDWIGAELNFRHRRAELFSHARCTNEIYDLDNRYMEWKMGRWDRPVSVEKVNCSCCYQKRQVPMPLLRIIEHPVLTGLYSVCPGHKEIERIPEFETEEYLQFIKENNVEEPSKECASETKMVYTGSASISKELSEIYLTAGEAKDSAMLDFDFQKVYSAFLGIEFTCSEPITIDLIHGDLLNCYGELSPRRSGSNCTVRLHCDAGHYCFETMEPYSVRYLSVVIRKFSQIKVKRVFLRSYEHESADIGFLCADDEMNRIYEAAKKTLQANVADVLMDCPGRERGGWLCDSYWTARAERLLFGNNSVESVMLENFLNFDPSVLKEGIFPVCYPAEFGNKGCYLPNWLMFFVLELFEYEDRTGDWELIDQFEEIVQKLIAYFEQYENSYGLLEDLDGFVFLEWSAANNDAYKLPISVSTNALYAKMLQCAGKLYLNTQWIEKSEYILRVLEDHAIGESGFFADALIHSDNCMTPKNLISEVTQYYCLWCGVGHKNKDWLLRKLRDCFGPCPKKYGRDPKVSPADLFIGYFLRFELLAECGEYSVLFDEIKEVFTYMIAHGPGTLWEHLSPGDSVCHGFSSHGAVWLIRDLAGIGIPDEIKHTILFAPHLQTKWAKACVDTPHGLVSVSWYKNENEFVFHAFAPFFYDMEFCVPEEVRGWKCVYLNGREIDVSQFTKKIKGKNILSISVVKE